MIFVHYLTGFPQSYIFKKKLFLTQKLRLRKIIVFLILVFQSYFFYRKFTIVEDRHDTNRYKLAHGRQKTGTKYVMLISNFKTNYILLAFRIFRARNGTICSIRE